MHGLAHLQHITELGCFLYFLYCCARWGTLTRPVIRLAEEVATGQLFWNFKINFFSLLGHIPVWYTAVHIHVGNTWMSSKTLWQSCAMICVYHMVAAEVMFWEPRRSWNESMLELFSKENMKCVLSYGQNLVNWNKVNLSV